MTASDRRFLTISTKRITGLDFARIIMTFGIVAYHFACYSAADLRFLNVHANGVWGGTLNSAFFALSGFCLQNKYGNIRFDILEFYYKRWKTVVFPYALIFTYAFLNNVATYGKFFYLNIPKWLLLLSFIGEDGYVQWFHPTYFIIGVWFVGAIILIYLLYPLINKFFKLNTIVYLIILFVLYEVLRIKGPSATPIDINPVTCILSFSVGMALSTVKDFLFTWKAFLVSGIISIPTLFIPIGLSHNTKELIIGWMLFVFMSNLGNRIQSVKFHRVISTLSRLSYTIILIHLPVLHKILIGWNTDSIGQSIIVLIGTLSATCVLSVAVDIIIKWIYNTKPFVWLDSKFIK